MSGAISAAKRIELGKHGWTELECSEETSLQDFGRSIGEIIPTYPDQPLTRWLIPTDKHDSLRKSLSSYYGFGVFPYHTDCAYYRRPPDLLLLRSARPSAVATLLVDGLKLADNCGQDTSIGLFEVQGLRKKFIAPVLQNGFIRWDPHCMKPLDLVANRVAHFFSEDVTQLSLRYQYSSPSKVLAIDNRRLIHSRENASSDADRRIESILVLTTE